MRTANLSDFNASKAERLSSSMKIAEEKHYALLAFTYGRRPPLSPYFLSHWSPRPTPARPLRSPYFRRHRNISLDLIPGLNLTRHNQNSQHPITSTNTAKTDSVDTPNPTTTSTITMRAANNSPFTSTI